MNSLSSKAINNNKTYEFITSMQEIKLQDCEQRRRWEWEDVQADLFGVQMKSLKLQQTQEAGSIFINGTEKHRHHGGSSNSRHSWTAYTWYDACRTIHHWTTQLSCRTADGVLLFGAGRKDKVWSGIK